MGHSVKLCYMYTMCHDQINVINTSDSLNIIISLCWKALNSYHGNRTLFVFFLENVVHVIYISLLGKP
jgi:hypothetical protein